MESQNHVLQDRSAPVQYVRNSRAFRQFKNPPQPHMCIQDTIKDTTEKLFINVLGWQKIANPKHYSDPIPLYGGMQVLQGCGVTSTRPPLLVFAVMVNPDILKANGKNATNVSDREALVNLLCDFVEAMNPGLLLARNPLILKDRDLAGELKDVWLAVQNKREREKGMNQDVMYKVYDIDGIGNNDSNEDHTETTELRDTSQDLRDPKNDNVPNTGNRPIKSSKQILINAGQTSEFDSGMNNVQINQNNNAKDVKDTTYCTNMYGQIVSSRENHNQINDIQQKLTPDKPSSSFRKDWNTVHGKTTEDWNTVHGKTTEDWNTVHGKTTEGWDEFSKRSITIKDNTETNECVSNGKHYDFFPVFDNKTAQLEAAKDSTVSEKHCTDNEQLKGDKSKIIIEPMQNLVLHQTDNKLCDTNASSLSSLSS